MTEIEQRIAAGAPAPALTVDVVRGRMRAALFGASAVAPSSARYTILERLGEGGMGTVWAAWDRKLDRKVALKLLRPERVDDPAASHRRILREAQALARVSDPHVVGVFDVTSWAPPDAPQREHVLLAMEFIAGETLASWLQRDHPLAAVVEKLVDSARGLMAAHGAGVIHGDFKPANVIVGRDGRARVVDFGLARVTEDPAREAGIGEPVAAQSAANLGEPRVAGTPLYMAPEQHDGRAIDARADQYALCVSLWEAVMRQAPFRGETLAELHEAKLAFESRRPPPGMPRWLHRVLVRGLAPSPADRHPSIAAVVSALQRGLRPRWRVPAALTVIGASVVAVVAVRDTDPCDGGDARVAGIWNADRHEQAAAAFERSGLAYAAVTWQSTAARVDGWAEQWAAAWRDACETHRAGAQSDELLDLRMTCLDGRLEHLDALAGLLVAGESDTIEHAVEAASRLPGLERCGDTVALRQVVAGPEDATARAEVAALGRELALARAQLDAGRHQAAATASEQIAAAARAMPTVYLPLVAEALGLQADALGWLGQVDPARERWRESALLAERAGDDELFVRASAGLIWELANEGARLETATEWAALADATVARVDDMPHAEYLLHNAVGTLAMFAGDYDRARDELAQGLALVERTWGATDFRLLALHTNAGNLELKAERLEAALEHYRVALEIGIATLGPEHPRVIVCRHDLAVALVGAGRSVDAVPELERLVEAQRGGGGAAYLGLGWSLASLAMAETNIGRDDAARDHADEALALLRDVDTAGYARAVARLAKARASTHLGDLDAAAADASAALIELRSGPHTPADESQALAIIADITDRVLAEARLDRLRGDVAGARARVVAHRRRLDETSSDRARLDAWLVDVDG